METLSPPYLLLATPSLRDPNFERTVVFLLAHADVGTLGVVLNRPSVTPVAQMLPAWAAVATTPDLLFLGGPVNVDHVIGLIDGPAEPGAHDGGPLLGSVTPVDLNETPEALPRPPRATRLFAGSAGWGPRQLEGELDEGAWWVLDATVADVFTPDPAGLWQAVLRRQPGRLAWFANALGDPEQN
jgi:putative transcriptional regulator